MVVFCGPIAEVDAVFHALSTEYLDLMRIRTYCLVWLIAFSGTMPFNRPRPCAREATWDKQAQAQWRFSGINKRGLQCHCWAHEQSQSDGLLFFYWEFSVVNVHHKINKLSNPKTVETMMIHRRSWKIYHLKEWSSWSYSQLISDIHSLAVTLCSEKVKRENRKLSLLTQSTRITLPRSVTNWFMVRLDPLCTISMSLQSRYSSLNQAGSWKTWSSGQREITWDLI